MIDRKEAFFVRVAKRFDFSLVNDDGSKPAELWIDDKFGRISLEIMEHGLNPDLIADIEYHGTKSVSIYVLTGASIEVYERDFRGYVLSKGDKYIPCSEMVHAMRDAYRYGNGGFDSYDDYVIDEVIHDDFNDRIEYYLQCLVESVCDPILIEI